MPREDDIRRVLAAHGTRVLWHYTAAANLSSIFAAGNLFCRAELQRRGNTFISTHYYGVGSREAVYGEYVSFAHLPPWGMMQFETQEVAILGFLPRICERPGTCFCPGWSPTANFNPEEVVTWTSAEALETLYSGPGYATVRGAETFVPKAVPLQDLLLSVVFFDKEARDRHRPALVRALQDATWRPTAPIRLTVEPSRFPTQWQDSGPPWEGAGE